MVKSLFQKIELILKIVMVNMLIITISISVLGKPPKWFSKMKQIKLMKTTKLDVERVFNYPKITYSFEGEWSKRVEYKLKEGELSVSYSQGKCSKLKTDGYDVDKDVVIGATIYLKKPVSISKLNLDLNKFDKREISDLVGIFTYVNEESGEWFNGSLHKLQNFKLFRTEEQENFKCDKPK